MQSVDMCLPLQQGIRGENEAREHARLTGHQVRHHYTVMRAAVAVWAHRSCHPTLGRSYALIPPLLSSHLGCSNGFVLITSSADCILAHAQNFQEYR